MNLRPDEAAAQSQIEYAKKASGLLKTGANVALSAAGFAGASRITPFLSELIPTSLAISGLKKVSPKVGEFVEKTMENGFSADNVLDFLRDKFTQKPQIEAEEEQEAENPIIKEAKIFESDFPDLAQGIANLMKSGRTPQESADILQKSVGPRVKEAEKKIGKKFIDFINDLFGSEQKAGQPQQQQRLSSRGQQNAPQSGQEEVDPELKQLIQGLRSSLQGLKGQ